MKSKLHRTVKRAAPPAKTSRRVRATPAQFKFASENQRLSGFPGHISAETAAYEVDMDEIAKSAARFGAQIPSPENRAPKPRITRFGSRPARPARDRARQQAAQNTL